jgi:tetratricopeptide (TPR) repeat protein
MRIKNDIVMYIFKRQNIFMSITFLFVKHNIIMKCCLYLLIAFVLIPQAVMSGDISNCESASRQLIFEGKYDEAIEVITNCNSVSISAAKKSELVALVYFRKGNYNKAFRIADEVPDSVASESLISLKAKISYSSGWYQKSAGYYKKLTQIDSCNAGYYRQAASSYFNIGNRDNAVSFIRNALVMKYPDVRSTLLAAKIFYSQELLHEADSLLALSALYDSIPLYFKLRGDVNYKMKEYETAWNCYRAYLNYGNTEQSVIRKAGISRFMMGVADEAITILSVAYTMNPADEMCCYYLGSAYQSEGDYKKAELFYNAAIKNGFSKNLALYYHRLGINYEQQGEYKKTLEAFKTAYSYSNGEKDSHVNILFEIARVYDVYLADTTGAVNTYKSFLTSSTDSTSANYRYALTRIHVLERDSAFNGPN